MRMTTRTLLPLVVAAALATALAGCSPADGDTTATTPSAPTTGTTSHETQDDTADCVVCGGFWASYGQEDGEDTDLTLAFLPDGSLEWFAGGTEGEGTWSSSNADSISITFTGSTRPPVPSPLVLTVEEIEKIPLSAEEMRDLWGEPSDDLQEWENAAANQQLEADALVNSTLGLEFLRVMG
ncbi:MAG: hypothetical protein FWH11_12865 [Micrococcales bacterium]|nr:hypothetical protein [Micrococcales bacterium]